MTIPMCSVTGRLCQCGTPAACRRRPTATPISEDTAVDRIKHQRRQASFDESRELAQFAIDQAIYNIGQMIALECERFGGQTRRGQQPELREIQRAAERIRVALGGKGFRGTL